MGTTTHFERELVDAAERKNKVLLEIGHSSPTGLQQMYLRIDDKFFAIDDKDARDIYEAVSGVAAYLQLDK